jgi:hypothetical protein
MRSSRPRCRRATCGAGRRRSRSADLHDT